MPASPSSVPPKQHGEVTCYHAPYPVENNTSVCLKPSEAPHGQLNVHSFILNTRCFRSSGLRWSYLAVRELNMNEMFSLSRNLSIRGIEQTGK